MLDLAQALASRPLTCCDHRVCHCIHGAGGTLKLHGAQARGRGAGELQQLRHRVSHLESW